MTFSSFQKSSLTAEIESRTAFCFLAAYLDTGTASDAPLSDDFGLPLLDFNSLGRTLADAGVAASASFFYGGDNWH